MDGRVFRVGGPDDQESQQGNSRDIVAHPGSFPGTDNLLPPVPQPYFGFAGTGWVTGACRVVIRSTRIIFFT
jgi:hypothetical protein